MQLAFDRIPQLLIHRREIRNHLVARTPQQGLKDCHCECARAGSRRPGGVEEIPCPDVIPHWSRVQPGASTKPRDVTDIYELTDT